MSDLNNSESKSILDENGKPIVSESKYNEFIGSFYDSRDEEFQVKFLNEINSGSSLSSETKTFLQSFLSEKKSDFPGISIDKIDYLKLKKALISEILDYKSKRSKLKTIITNNYNTESNTVLTPEYYSNNIETHINKLTLKELNNLISTPKILEKFLLKERLELKIIDSGKKEFLGIFSDLGFEQVLDTLNDDEKQNLSYLFGELQNCSIASSHRFTYILNQIFEVIPNNGFKKKVLKKYLSSITIKDATSLGLLKSTDNEKILKYIGFTEKEIKKIKDEKIGKIINEIRDYEVSLDELDFSGNQDLSTIFKKYSTEIFNNLNYGILEKEGNVDKEGFIESIKENKKVNGIENFKEGNIITISQKNNDGTIVKVYYEIYSFGNESENNKKIHLIERGGDKMYNSGKNNKLISLYYNTFLEKINSDKIISFDIDDIKNIKEKINSGEIKESDNSFYSTLSDIQAKDLNQEQILRQDLIDDLIKKGKIKDQEEYDDFVKNDTNKGVFNDALLEVYNKNKVKEKLDSIDSSGSLFGFDVGLTFFVSSKNGTSGDYYTVEDLKFDDCFGEIKLSRIGGGVETLNFEDFCNTFEQKNCKRTSIVSNFSDLIGDLDKSTNAEKNPWGGDFVIRDNKIINTKDTEKKYNYNILSSNGNSSFLDDSDLIKINSISGNSVSINFGKLKKDGNNTIYSFDDSETIISIGMLSSFIKKSGLIPENLEKKKESSKNSSGKYDDIKTDNLKGSFWSRYVNDFYSVANLVSLGKSYLDFWKGHFAEGDREKANKLLSKMPGLTQEQRDSLLRFQENNEKKRMDEFLEKLKVLTSKDAIGTVERRITDMNSSEAQKEAAMMFMIEKYGTLYTKGALMKHKGSFLWYRALGGKIGDELFEKIRKESLENPGGVTNFTEEKLIHRLLKMQCENGWKPKRRGKMYKEYEAIIGNGRSSEKEKGKKDAVKKRNFTDRVNFAIDELADGSWPNAMGAMEAILGKGNDGKVGTLNALPFVMMTSGAAYSFDEEDADSFKNGIVPTQFFVSRSSFIDVYNKTFVQLSYDIERKLGGKYIGMGKAADDLINNSKGKSETERIKISQDFYLKKADGEWGDILGRAMMFLNTRKIDKESEFETWIIDNAEQNSTYKSYVNIFFAGTGNNRDSRLKATDVFDDAFKCQGGNNDGTGGTTAWGIYDIARKYLEPQSGGVGFRDDTSGTNTLREIRGQIDSIILNTNLSFDYKKRRLSNLIRPVLDAIKNSYGQNENAFNAIFENKSNLLYGLFLEIGVKKEHFESGKDFRESKNDDIDLVIDNLISNGINIISNNTGSPLEEAQDFIKDTTHKLIK